MAAPGLAFIAGFPLVALLIVIIALLVVIRLNTFDFYPAGTSPTERMYMIVRQLGSGPQSNTGANLSLARREAPARGRR